MAASSLPPQVSAAPDLFPPVKRRHPWVALARRHPSIVIGGGLLLVIVVMAVAAQWLGTVDPNAIAPAKRNRAPSAEFWFGTDALGRDLYSRVLYGAQVSLMVGVAVAVCATILGLATGLVAGAVRALAVSGPRRLQVLPAVPTVAETLAGFAGESWQGLFAPRGTPPEVIATLSRLTRAILATEEFRGRLQELGLVPEGGTPEEFQTFIAEESPIWARVIRDNGITLDGG